jgi:hypothetical protein
MTLAYFHRTIIAQELSPNYVGYGSVAFSINDSFLFVTALAVQSCIQTIPDVFYCCVERKSQ